jgi:hypothetical protein
MKFIKTKRSALNFISYFIVGFSIGLLISIIGGFFHDAPNVMWKETFVLSSATGLLSGFGGDKFLDRLGNILKYFNVKNILYSTGNPVSLFSIVTHELNIHSATVWFGFRRANASL